MKKKYVTNLYFAGLVAVIILISLFLAYGTNFSDPYSTQFKNFYPQVLVGRDLVSIAYWDQAQLLAKKLDVFADAQQVSDQLVKIKKERQLLDNLKVSYSSPNIADELKFYKTGKSQDYQNLIDKYFNSNENLFTEFVVRPRVYDALLRMKYNSDFKANAVAYNRAQNILDQLKSGKSFEEMAKSESDDKITGQLGGDLGFVASGEILPELEKAIVTAQFGQVDSKIVISRLGYHIIYPVETAEKDGIKTWRVKHILVKTSGFDNWLNPMLNKFWVWRIK